MRSPEFQLRLDQARVFRSNESYNLRTARSNGLRKEAKEYISSLKTEPAYQDAKKLLTQDRWEKLGAKIPEFSEEVWEEAGQILSGLNNGVKAGLFLEIANNTNPGTYMSVDDITSRFKALFAGTELLEAFGKYTKVNLISYSQQSLCNVGLLTKEYDFEGEVIGFGVTEKGKRIGVAVAQNVLWYESRFNQSLQPILGQTSSPTDKRSALNRSKTLDFLVKHPIGARKVDVMSILSLQGAITERALSLFSDLGLITYKSLTSVTDKRRLKYQVKDGYNLREAQKEVTSHFANEIINIILMRYQSDSFTIADISKDLSLDTKERFKDPNLREKVAKVLRGLAKKDFLHTLEDFKGVERQSDASLTLKGRRLYVDFIYPVLSVISGQPLGGIQKVIQEDVLNNFYDYTKTSADLYYPHSNSNKIRQKKTNKLKILEMLMQSKEPLPSRELAEKIGLCSSTVTDYFRPKIKGSTIVLQYGDQTIALNREKIHGVWYYGIKE